MPPALAATPRKMLPPPMTMATCTPRTMTSRTSSAMRSSTGGSMPYPWSPASASPESFRTIRRYAGRRRPASAVMLPPLADLKAREALDDDALTRLGVDGVHELPHARFPGRILDIGLLEQ